MECMADVKSTNDPFTRICFVFFFFEFCQNKFANQSAVNTKQWHSEVNIYLSYNRPALLAFSVPSNHAPKCICTLLWWATFTHSFYSFFSNQCYSSYHSLIATRLPTRKKLFLLLLNWSCARAFAPQIDRMKNKRAELLELNLMTAITNRSEAHEIYCMEMETRMLPKYWKIKLKIEWE